MIVKEITIEELLSDYNWAEVFADESSGNTDKTTNPVPPGSCVSTEPASREDVAEIIAAVNGENDGAEWVGLFLLKDGVDAMKTARSKPAKRKAKPLYHDLYKVIEAIEKTPDEMWDMSIWWEEHSWGTVGCAIGNFCHQNPGDALYFSEKCQMPFMNRGRYTGTHAVAKRFGISLSDALYTFNPDDYHNLTRAEEIRRIRAVIRKMDRGAAK